jgi:hypothetical protein
LYQPVEQGQIQGWTSIWVSMPDQQSSVEAAFYMGDSCFRKHNKLELSEKLAQKAAQQGTQAEDLKNRPPYGRS